jgi:hypothetical protein
LEVGGWRIEDGRGVGSLDEQEFTELFAVDGSELDERILSASRERR